MSSPHRTSTSHPSPVANGRSSGIADRIRSPHCSYTAGELTVLPRPGAPRSG
jgi:hypothetical protein